MLRENRLLNAQLTAALTAAGHGDLIVVADAGLPISPGTPLLDLAVVPGVPSAADLLAVVLEHFVVEASMVAEQCPAGLTRQLDAASLRTIDHAHLKALSANARLVIRTGECTPFANVVLVAGVPF